MSSHLLQFPSAHYNPSQETTLYLLPKVSPRCATDYTINNAINGKAVFRVTGKKYGSTPGREFRDESGLPLFKLTRGAVLSRWPWRITLPDNKEKDLGRVCARDPSMKIKLHIARNCVIGDRKREDEMVRLEVRRTTTLYMLGVLVEDGDNEEKWKVADIRECVERNKTVGHWPGGPYDHVPPKRVLDMKVAEGWICRFWVVIMWGSHTSLSMLSWEFYLESNGHNLSAFSTVNPSPFASAFLAVSIHSSYAAPYEHLLQHPRPHSEPIHQNPYWESPWTTFSTSEQPQDPRNLVNALQILAHLVNMDMSLEFLVLTILQIVPSAHGRVQRRYPSMLYGSKGMS